MSFEDIHGELEVYKIEYPDLIPEEVNAEPYDEYSERAKRIVSETCEDLESALNYVRQYQRALDMLCAPDPNGDGPQLLLQKYNMNHKKPEESIAKKKMKELESSTIKELEPGND